MKNGIFGGIVSLTICGVIFAILCVTDVINFDEKICKKILSGDPKRTFISEDKYYNYFLYTLPNDRLLIIKGDKSDKYFSLVLDLDYDYQYGIVNYDKLNNYTKTQTNNLYYCVAGCKS